MLYARLTLRNLKRSVKEYAIFFMTLVLAITVIYAFNAVAQSEQIQAMGQHMDVFGNVIIGVSVAIVIALGWLISYISQFIIRKRSCELGTYMLMGMKRKAMTRMFLFEQFLIGLVALLVGLILGMFVYQLLQAMIFHVFDKAMILTFDFSSSAILLTIGFFAAIYFVELCREHRILKKTSIHSMLYFESTPEKVRVNHKRTIVYFILSLVCYGVGMWLANDCFTNLGTNNATMGSFYGMMIILIISVYLFFISVSDFISYIINQFHKIKYRGSLMFQYRMLYGRIKSSRFILSALSVITILILVMVSVGLKIKDFSEASIQTYAPFDIMISAKKSVNQDQLTSYLDKKGVTYQAHQYTIYRLDQAKSMRHALKDWGSYRSKGNDYFLKESDYLKLMEIKGKTITPLSKQSYRILASDSYQAAMKSYEKQHPLMINGDTMSLKQIQTFEIGQSKYEYFIVLPDAYFEDAKMVSSQLIADTKQPTTTAMWYDFSDMKWAEDTDEDYQFSIIVEAYWIEANLVSYVLITFSIFYAALIFTCIAAAIIATHQINDFDRHRYQYRLLHQMGVPSHKVKHVLARQIAIYFAIPLLLPLLYVFPLLTSIGDMFAKEMMGSSIYQDFWYAFIIYILLNCCYYGLTYFSCKRHLDC